MPAGRTGPVSLCECRCAAEPSFGYHRCVTRVQTKGDPGLLMAYDGGRLTPSVVLSRICPTVATKSRDVSISKSLRINGMGSNRTPRTGLKIPRWRHHGGSIPPPAPSLSSKPSKTARQYPSLTGSSLARRSKKVHSFSYQPGVRSPFGRPAIFK